MKSLTRFLLAGFFLLNWCMTGWTAETASDLQLVFDPQLRVLIREAIATSEKQIEVEVFKLTDRGVIRDLAQAAQRGILVRVILCPTQKTNQKAADRLMTAGAQVRWYPLQHKNQIMHLKLGCFDQQQLIFGSPNWTYWGLTLHHEGVLVIRHADVIQSMLEQFEQDWDKSLTEAPLKFLKDTESYEPTKKSQR